MIGPKHKPKIPKPSLQSQNVNLLFLNPSLQNIDYKGRMQQTERLTNLGVYPLLRNNNRDSSLNDSNSILLYINNYALFNVIDLKISDLLKIKILSFLSLIYSRVKNDRNCDKLGRDENWTQLYSKLLEENYNPRDLPVIRDVLTLNGIIEIDNRSKTGRGAHSKSFRIVDKYFKKFYPARVVFYGGKQKDALRHKINQFWKKADDYELEKAKKKLTGEALTAFLRRRSYLLDVQSRLTITPENEGLLIDENKAGDCRSIVHGLSRLHEKRWTANTDNAGRWYHLLTSVKKEIRKYIEIDGEATVELDFKSLHPFLASKLYPENCQENESYISLLQNGKFYEGIAEMVGECIKDDESKKDFKIRVFQEIFFGPHWEAGYTLLREFKAKFPILTDIMRRLKGGREEFAVKLQRMEADIMITGILDKLIEEKIPVLTVHDSIICKEVDELQIRALMETEFIASVGVPPIISKTTYRFY